MPFSSAGASGHSKLRPHITVGQKLTSHHPFACKVIVIITQQIHILLVIIYCIIIILPTQLLSAAWRGQTLLSKCKARANKKLSPSCRLDQQQGWSGGLAAARLMFSASTPQGSVLCAAPGAGEKNLHFSAQNQQR